MGAVKHLLMQYCEIIHPDDYDAQDRLFDDIVSGNIQVSLEEMSRIVKEHESPPE